MRYENFELDSTNVSKFMVSDFERKIYGSHLSRIRTALREGKMFDVVITVIEKGNRYEIVDGQHRFSGLVNIIKELKLKSYPIVLRVLEKKELSKYESREIYLAIDSGKPLTTRDILKVYENGECDFFKILKPYCRHYGSKTFLSFFDILAAHHYATSGDHILDRRMIKKALDSVSRDNLLKLKFIIENIYIVNRDLKYFLYSGICFRNIVKILFNNPFLIQEGKKFQDFLKNLSKDSFLEIVKTQKDSDSYKTVYNHMLKKLR